MPLKLNFTGGTPKSIPVKKKKCKSNKDCDEFCENVHEGFCNERLGECSELYHY